MLEIDINVESYIENVTLPSDENRDSLLIIKMDPLFSMLL
jgi:hypothetical protein